MIAPGPYAALLDGMDAELKQAETEIEVVSFTLGRNIACMETAHNGYRNRVTVPDQPPTIATLNMLIRNSVALHAKRMPRHQEFAALAKKVAA
jgi:hypothetical protein